MLELPEVERRVEGKIALANAMSTAAVRAASLLTVRTQIRLIKGELGASTLAQSIAAVMACTREGCERRA